MIQIKDLFVIYPATPANVVANRGISIEIPDSGPVLITGPNGSGKSTLLKLLCGEISSNHDIAYFGKQKHDWEPEKSAKHIAMLPQHSTLTFPFLAREVVELGAIPLSLSNKETTKLALHYMEQTDVMHLAESLYPSLSGGEKQRLHLARVMTQLHQSGEERILMLDEPTSALDRSVQLTVIDLLKDLQKKHNIGYLFISHDLSVVKALSDRVLVMQKGEVMEQGTAENIFQNPKNDYTKKLIDASFDLENSENQHSAA